MWRAGLGIVAGLAAWILIVSLIDRGLRLEIPNYAAAEHSLDFTLTMKVARLIMAAVTSLLAGTVVRLVAPASRFAPWIVGLVLVAVFLPEHIHLWPRFPIWYHLSFLVPLALLPALGARILRRVRTKA